MRRVLHHLIARARRGRFSLRALARIALVAPGVALAACAGLGLHHVYLDRGDMPDLEPFLRFRAPTIGRIEDHRGVPLIRLAREYRTIVRYEDLSPVMIDALLAAEDRNFFRHRGVDYSVLPRVLYKAARRSASAWIAARPERAEDLLVLPQGGSTLTQQLARGYFLPGLVRRERGGELISRGLVARGAAAAIGVRNTNKLIRKIEEIRLALWLEHAMERHYGSRRRAKEEILARYASFVYVGAGRYGFVEASRHYFGRSVSCYGPRDAGRAALLAGAIKAPRHYAPVAGNLERAAARRNEVLALMARRGRLCRGALAAFTAEPIELASTSALKTFAPAAVETAFGELRAVGRGRFNVDQLFTGEIHVRTTVDARVQRIVNAALENGLQAFEARHPESRGIVQGSVVVLRNADAAILAEAGGRQVYKDRPVRYSDLNRATRSRRQPGSALKPIVYLAALTHGSRLDTTVNDAPIGISMGLRRPRKWINNYDARFKGPLPLRQALAESRNAATVWLTRRIGMKRVLQTARDLGLRTRLEPYISTALGASEISLLELANAYRAMAAETIAEPHIVLGVTDVAGAPLFERRTLVTPLPIDRAALRQIQEGLRGVVRLPGGTAHSLASGGFPIPVMGKTGTTNRYRDALFVGSTYGPAGITVAVRLGYDDNRALGSRETGARAALPIFKEIMLRVYGDGIMGEPPRFPDPIERGIDAYLDAAETESCEACYPRAG